MGDLQVDLREDAAPMTARNFQMLVEDRYYDNTIMHRILLQGRNGRPFVIQGGDPTGSGSGGPGWWVPLEPSTLPHHFGVLSMARGDDPDSGGSQWFIALDRSETARLDGLYCAFGDVVTGADTLEALARVPIADSDYLSSRPVDPPAITRARLIPAPPRTPQSGRPDARVTPPTTSPWAAAAPPR
jgi:peptidyl-prolyl cis-trans isomerase B (cyclophilin B)